MREDDEKTKVNNLLPELLEEMRKVEITDVTIHAAWSREHSKGFTLQWGTWPNSRELTFFQRREDGSIRLQTEESNPEVCKEVLMRLLQAAWASHFGEDISDPSARSPSASPSKSDP